MEDACKDVSKTPLYFVNVFQGKLAFIELAFKEYVIDYSVNKRGDSCGSGI